MIHLRFLDLFLSAGNAIVVYDPYTNDTLQSYHGDEKLLISVTSESDSARVVFVRGSSQDATRIRFEIVHRALPQGKYSEVAAWQVTACMLQVCCLAVYRMQIYVSLATVIIFN